MNPNIPSYYQQTPQPQADMGSSVVGMQSMPMGVYVPSGFAVPPQPAYTPYGYMPSNPPQPMSYGQVGAPPITPGIYMPPSLPSIPKPGVPQPGMPQTAFGQAISYNEAEDACRRLYSAFKGLGTNDREVISVLSSYNKCQLNEIAVVYNRKYGRTLASALKSEISGNYLQMALAILYQPHKMEAHFISEAIKKKSLEDHDALVEILATRTYADLQKIASTFQTSAFNANKKSKKTKSFNDFILDGTASKRDLHNFVKAILLGPRSTANADNMLASRDARDLIIAAKGLGTDEHVFFDIFAHRSFEHLREVAKEVQVQKKKTLEKLVKSEFSRVMERALLYILYNAKSPAYGQAYIIYRAVKGAGTRDDALIRAIAYIYDTDMLEDVKVAFKNICGKDMVKYVESDTTFNYRKLCVSLLNFRGKKLTIPMNVGYK